MAKLLMCRLFCISSNCQRNIWTSTIQCSKQSIQKATARRNERYMKKTVDLLNGNKSQKGRKWKSFAGGEPPGSGFLSAPQTKPGNSHRARQLSVIFHEYITSLVSSGEACPALLDHGFEIIKVQMPSDLSSVNVHWLASDSEKDDAVTALLPECASALRSTLTGLRLTGHVPPVLFCKDLTYARLQRVEELLKIADMGPDFEPTDEIDDTEIANPLKAVNQTSINEKMQRVAKRFSQHSESESQQKSFGSASNLFHAPPSTHSEQNDPDYPKQLSTANTQSVGVVPPVDEFAQLNLRSDLYGIPREELKQKLLQAKRKLQDRSSPSNSEKTKEDELQTRDRSEEFSKSKASEQLTGFKYVNRKKDRLYRNADSILSSVHHMDNTHCKQDTD